MKYTQIHEVDFGGDKVRFMSDTSGRVSFDPFALDRVHVKDLVKVLSNFATMTIPSGFVPAKPTDNGTRKRRKVGARHNKTNSYVVIDTAQPLATFHNKACLGARIALAASRLAAKPIQRKELENALLKEVEGARASSMGFHVWELIEKRMVLRYV